LNSQSVDFSQYSRLRDVFCSWFWRYYDHLGHLIVYNLSWFLTCYIVAWVPLHKGLFGTFSAINIPCIYIVFLAESMVSVGWAYLIFKIFTQGEGVIGDIWLGTKKYIFKALGVSAVSGLVVGLAFYNINFYFFLKSSYRFLDLLLVGFVFWILLFLISSMFYQWPILFFQDPPFLKIFYKSYLLVLGNGLVSLAVLAFFMICLFLFLIVPFLWECVGFVFFFSFQCVMLEKHLLRYKIVIGDKPIEPFLELLNQERNRGWRDLLRPWENR
jgi:hypothetical protein